MAASEPPSNQHVDQTAASCIRILLADDHPLLRAGTRRILEDEPGLLVVGEAGDGGEAVALAASLHPDVLVLDISMPTMDGITACAEIQRIAPRTCILILTAHERAAYIRAFHRMGVSGYLLKSAPASELVQAVRQVNAGAYAYYAGAHTELRQSECEAAGPTARELEVMRQLANGRTNREISEALHLSENTIEFHVRNAYKKLGATSRTDAARSAQRLGWLDTSDPLC